MKLFFLFFITFNFCIAETITGKVVYVADGDTATVVDDSNRKHIIRFNHIDAPELKGQSYGKESRVFVQKLILNKKVTVDISKKDRYKRSIGVIYLGKTNVNLEIVKAGLAWHYKKYSKDKQFANAEILAKANKKGLWRNNNPTPPWLFRKK